MAYCAASQFVLAFFELRLAPLGAADRVLTPLTAALA